MLDIDIEEKHIIKVGGKFRLTSLVQKRMVELHRPGARVLVNTDRGRTRKDLLRIALEEILQDKIQLAPREEVGYSFEVVRFTDSAGLNPIARQVAEALSAGANNAVREVRPGK